jgi:hypothetical protein
MSLGFRFFLRVLPRFHGHFKKLVRFSQILHRIPVNDAVRLYLWAAWTLIRVPFSSPQSSIFGQRVNVAPINLSQIVGVGIYIADGQDGDFSLEIDHIRAYTD